MSHIGLSIAILAAATAAGPSPPDKYNATLSLAELRNRLREEWGKLKTIDESERKYVLTRRTINKRDAAHGEVNTKVIEVGDRYFIARWSQGSGECSVARNPQYSFCVDNLSGKGWKLAAFGEGDKLQSNACLQFILSPANLINFYPLSSFKHHLPEDALDDSGLNFTGIRLLEDGCYEIKYSSRVVPPGRPKGEVVRSDGRMVLNPRMHWCVISREQHRDGEVAAFKIEREVERIGDKLVCRRYTETPPGDKPSTSWEFSDYSFHPFDARERCYLSHYGLPEPAGSQPPSRPTPMYVWLMLGAGVLSLLAFLLRWLSRRGGLPEK
jgi:hypothetical protein